MARESSAAESPQRRSGLLRDQVQLLKKKHCNRYEIVPIPESLSFDKGFYIVIRACQLLAQKNEGTIFVGVAGPSGAGKTVFTENVLSLMPSVSILSMDNYNDASRIIDGNFDDPRLTDYETLLENIHGLKEGKTVQVPIYDFKASCRTGYRAVGAPSSRIVIIEGIYALSERLRPLLDLRVSVTGGIHFDLVKRVLRDIQRADQEPEEIIQQVSETVYPMYKAFIEPDLQTAHIKIINKFNPFSGFQNPMYILKSTKTLTVDKIKAVISKEHTEKIDEIYDIYLLPPGEDPEACQSYLRMRNRDGIYNLMFEEWVTDNPFIISPRISFEVSVRLLGGLMALGYTIAAILKRRSHVFSDDKVNVKIDWLEKLNRHYVQVQGRDRLSVKHVAEQLGLDGSYAARTYIEQIQLEKLVKEVMTLPDDLMEKLSIDKESISSHINVSMKNKHLRSGLSHSYSAHGEKSISNLTRLMNGTDQRSEGRITGLPTLRNEVISQLTEQISTLNERLDVFTSQMEDLNLKLITGKPTLSQKNMSLQNDPCNGSSLTTLFSSGLENGTVLRTSSSYSQLVDFPLMEEIAVIAKGQCHIMHHLDNLSKFVHEHLHEEVREKKINSETRILDADLIRRPVIIVLAAGGLGILLCKFLYRN